MMHKTGLESVTVRVNHRELRCGYTTGTCAAAAAGAAAGMLLTGAVPEEYEIMTPEGIPVSVLLEDAVLRDDAGEEKSARCAVRKDAGDDADATDGMLIYAEVRTEKETENAGDQTPDVLIDGGEGIGRVTKPGLDQPVGAAAINSVPRRMIKEEVLKACSKACRSGLKGKISVIISAPAGKEIAKKTFNERLGIQGGISILGTGGIVRPMSEQALIDAIRAEMSTHAASGRTGLLITPGNYGERFVREHPELADLPRMQCSNYVGETVDMAEELGIRRILFAAHIGKFVKVAAGIMNTHSHNADARMETIAAAALRCGADAGLAREILAANTTEEAVGILRAVNRSEKGRARVPEAAFSQGAGEETFCDRVMQELCRKICHYLDARSRGSVETGVILFSMEHGFLGASDNVPNLVEAIRQGVPAAG